MHSHASETSLRRKPQSVAAGTVTVSAYSTKKWSRPLPSSDLAAAGLPLHPGQTSARPWGARRQCASPALDLAAASFARTLARRALSQSSRPPQELPPRNASCGIWLSWLPELGWKDKGVAANTSEGETPATSALPLPSCTSRPSSANAAEQRPSLCAGADLSSFKQALA